jgi:hypothetical protein
MLIAKAKVARSKAPGAFEGVPCSGVKKGYQLEKAALS